MRSIHKQIGRYLERYLKVYYTHIIIINIIHALTHTHTQVNIETGRRTGCGARGCWRHSHPNLAQKSGPTYPGRSHARDQQEDAAQDVEALQVAPEAESDLAVPRLRFRHGGQCGARQLRAQDTVRLEGDHVIVAHAVHDDALQEPEEVWKTCFVISLEKGLKGNRHAALYLWDEKKKKRNKNAIINSIYRHFTCTFSLRKTALSFNT